MAEDQQIYEIIKRVLENYESKRYPNDQFALDDMYNLIILIKEKIEHNQTHDLFK